MKTRTYRLATLVATVAVSAVALFGTVAPAQAESPVLGTLALTPSSGSVADDPFVSSATTSGPCPTDFGQNVSLRVGPIGGPYSLLGQIGSGGGFDTGDSVTLAAGRSLAAALGGPVADGDYEVTITCSGVPAGTYPKNFSTFITVTGDSWQVAEPAETSVRLRVRPAFIAWEGQKVTLKAKVADGVADEVEFSTGEDSVGTAEVIDGKAKVTTTELDRGLHTLTATFTPDDPRLHRPSSDLTYYLVLG